MTHLNNISSIVECGAVYSDSTRAQQGVSQRNIGYQRLKLKRQRSTVRYPPGGVLADYVPFYFAPRSPMLSAIKHGRVDGCHQRDVIYLVSTVARIRQAGLRCVFTDMHPVMRFSQQFADLDRLHEVIDWDLMEARHWFNEPEQHPDRKERRQAEFLVHQQLPWQLINEVAVRNVNTAREVQEKLAAAGKRSMVRVKPDWYFTEAGDDDRHG